MAATVIAHAAPAGLDPDAIGAALAGRQHVAEVHDLHVWEITSGQSALSAHVLVEPGEDCHAVRADLAGLLAEQHDIEHATLQVDHAVRTPSGRGSPMTSTAKIRTAPSNARPTPPDFAHRRGPGTVGDRQHPLRQDGDSDV